MMTRMRGIFVPALTAATILLTTSAALADNGEVSITDPTDGTKMFSGSPQTITVTARGTMVSIRVKYINAAGVNGGTYVVDRTGEVTYVDTTAPIVTGADEKAFTITAQGLDLDGNPVGTSSSINVTVVPNPS